MKFQKIFCFLISFFMMTFGTGLPVQAVEPQPLPVSTGAAETEMITVNFNQADIHSVFRILALKGDVNIVAGQEIEGEVTMQLSNVPWLNAFETIVRVQGFTYEKEANIYYVLTQEAFKQRGESGIRTEVVTLKYADLAQVKAAIQHVADDVRIETVEGMNQILMTATPANLESAQKVIQQIDIKQPQVHIDAKIIRTALGKNENLGINWNAVASFNGAQRPTTFPFSPDPSARRLGKFLQRFDTLPIGQTAQESTVTGTSGGGTATESTTEFPLAHGFPFVEAEDFTFGTLDFTDFRLVFNMLKSRNNTKILSNPRIVVLNHQSARVQAGREIGLPTFERNESTGSLEITGYESRNDGIELIVVPHVSEDGEILVSVRPELTRFLGFKQVVPGESVLSPEFETTVAETQVLIHSGDTLVIGGLISETETDNRNKVPYLSSIPLLGKLFTHVSPNQERAETIIFVTVTLADDVYQKEALRQWKAAQAEYQDFQKESEEAFFKKREKKKAEKKNKKWLFW